MLMKHFVIIWLTRINRSKIKLLHRFNLAYSRHLMFHRKLSSAWFLNHTSMSINTLRCVYMCVCADSYLLIRWFSYATSSFYTTIRRYLNNFINRPMSSREILMPASSSFTFNFATKSHTSLWAKSFIISIKDGGFSGLNPLVTINSWNSCNNWRISGCSWSLLTKSCALRVSSETSSWLELDAQRTEMQRLATF